MPGANLPPGFDLGQRLSDMSGRLQTLETKSSMFEVESQVVNQFGFAVPASASATIPFFPMLAPATFIIPNGFTQAFIMATCTVGAWCQPPNGTTNDWFTAVTVIETNSPGGYNTWSPGLDVYANSDGAGHAAFPIPQANAFPSFSQAYDGLVGGYSITVGSQAYSGSGWAASSPNLACTVANVFFFP